MNLLRTLDRYLPHISVLPRRLRRIPFRWKP